MRTLVLFDFDGTLTVKDSLADFIIFCFGKTKFFVGLMMLSFKLVLYVVGVISNERAKEMVFCHFFEGCTERNFNKYAADYSNNRIPRILRKEAMERLNWHKLQRHEIVVVTASIENYMKLWCELEDVDLIATRLEFKENHLTGKFLTNNCYGLEKVKRIKEEYNLREFNYLYAYGDSRGDKEMLGIANEKYYKFKRVY